MKLKLPTNFIDNLKGKLKTLSATRSVSVPSGDEGTFPPPHEDIPPQTTAVKKDKKLLIVLIAVGVLIVLLLIAILIRLNSNKSMQEEVEKETSEQTEDITPPDVSFQPSPYAKDEEIIDLQQEISDIREEIEEVKLRDTLLVPPSLDFKISFSTS